MASMLFAAPAMAQPAQEQQAPPAVQAWQYMYQESAVREQRATAAAIAEKERNDALQAQVNALQAKLNKPAPSAATNPATQNNEAPPPAANNPPQGARH